ncbi:MAG: hypothetical protein E6H74_02950 [Betaproteobacteria bacterium]|nr:MAG: hypothetical protein E6H74_02950 [Betaproteobacteria bacterium]
MSDDRLPPKASVKPKIANFDSATAMLRALASHCRDEDFIALGSFPKWSTPFMSLVGALVNHTPEIVRNAVYTVSGWTEAVAQRKIVGPRTEPSTVARWLCDHYPKKRYPAIMLGSSNGALMHLCAACGIPWLPQTYLMPVAHRRLDPNDVAMELARMRPLALRFLAAYPEVQLHHMHDPSQDRLMVQLMSYFRLKYLRLPEAYQTFMEQCLQPGATICIVDCALRWPTTRLADRYIFQMGALGGPTADEYLNGGPRVAAFLAQTHASVQRWTAPAPDAERPEAEWGFESALDDEIRDYADRNGYRVERLTFSHPEDLSPLIADFHADWFGRHGIDANRLLVESFVLMDPHRAWRAGLVPFWMFFNMEPSLKSLRKYLEEHDFDDIGLMLFSHGVRSIGLAAIEDWDACLARARKRGFYIGVDRRAYPQDFATFVNYSRDLERRFGKINIDLPPVPYATARDFVRSRAAGTRVSWNSL